MKKKEYRNEDYCGWLAQSGKAVDRHIGSRRMSPGKRQVLSLMNMQIGSSETEEGRKMYTKQEVEMLLKDRFRGAKFDWRRKQEWTTDYIKRLKKCLKCLQDVVDESGLQTALKSQEEEFKAIVSKLETNILSLNESLAKEESEKLAALDCLKKEREAKMAIKKNRDSLRKELGRAEQNVLNANEKVKMLEQMYASLQEYNTQLQDELSEANPADNQVESEKPVILQELSTLRAHNTFHVQLIKPDPFSLLHDDILLDIMSRIDCTTKELIRTTSIISKRWRHLWAFVPHLIFHALEDDVDTRTNIQPYISFIDNTINLCAPYPNLKLFKFHTNYDTELNPEFKSRVNSWIHDAISHNVEEFDLRFWDLGGEGDFTYDDELFFNSSCITRIRLTCCVFNPPNGVISWGGLQSLCITVGTLDEDMLEKILSGSPCLETLELDNCYGYRHIDITSKSVKEFVFSGYNTYHKIYMDEDYIDCIQINAPYISSLTIKGVLILREIALLNVSSLVEADLGYYVKWSVISHKEFLRGLLESLEHVKDITLGEDVQFFSRMEESD